MIIGLFVLIYIVMLGGTAALAAALARRGREALAPFPQRSRLLRGPGESLARGLDRLDAELRRRWAVVFAGPPAVLAIATAGATGVGGGWGATLFGVGIVAACGWLMLAAGRLHTVEARRKNLALGLFGERVVAECLEPLLAGGCRVFHDVPAGEPGEAFNLDHVVVAPAGVFAIETKTRRKGRARVGFMADEIIYDGRALSYPWGEDRHGLDQAAKQAKWLASWLGAIPGFSAGVRAVLTFPGWTINRKGTGAVEVVAPGELASFILTAPPVLDAVTREQLASRLEARCRDVEL